MTLSLVFHVAGDCRYEGRSDALGAAACVSNLPARGYCEKKTTLPPHPTPTRRRVDLVAIIIAQYWAVDM